MNSMNLFCFLLGKRKGYVQKKNTKTAEDDSDNVSPSSKRNKNNTPLRETKMSTRLRK